MEDSKQDCVSVMGIGGRKFFRLQDLCRQIQTASPYPSSKQSELLSGHLFSCSRIGVVTTHLFPPAYFSQFLFFFCNCLYSSMSCGLCHDQVHHKGNRELLDQGEKEESWPSSTHDFIFILDRYVSCRRWLVYFGYLHPLLSHFIIFLTSVQKPHLWYTLVSWGWESHLRADNSNLIYVLLYVSMQNFGLCLM